VAEQPLLIPYSRSPWFWLLQTFPESRRALAEAVLRVQWSEIRREGGKSRTGLLSAAHRYVRQAERNPDSVRWAENAKGRVHAQKGDQWKKDLEKLAKNLFD
jgi:hypothetical protein